MQNEPFDPGTPVRHRRSERHAGDAGRNAAAQVHRERRAGQRGNRRSGKSAVSRRQPRMPRSHVLILVLMALICILGGYKTAESSLKIADLHAERARAAEEYSMTVLRHKPVYTDLIEEYCGKNGIEPAFVCAVIYRESHYDPTAVSGAGARGLMQLMPDTGTWWAEKLGLSGYTADSLFDPEINIRLGVRYLRYLSQKFGGDPILVACGYHAGAGNVESWLKKYSSDGVSLTLEEIPMDDTKTYAGRVLESYAIYLQNYYPSPAASRTSAGSASVRADDAPLPPVRAGARLRP